MTAPCRGELRTLPAPAGHLGAPVTPGSRGATGEFKIQCSGHREMSRKGEQTERKAYTGV